MQGHARRVLLCVCLASQDSMLECILHGYTAYAAGCESEREGKRVGQRRRVSLLAVF